MGPTGPGLLGQPGWPNRANQVGRARHAELSGWGLARLAWLTGPTDPGRLGSGQRLANLEDLCKKCSIPTWLPSLLAFRLALWTRDFWVQMALWALALWVRMALWALALWARVALWALALWSRVEF